MLLSETQSIITTNDAIYSVSAFSSLLKSVIASNLTKIKIRGEVSNLTLHSSGHTYFNLKDDKALLRAICWKSISMPVKLENGLEIICVGSITIYPGKSEYQIIVQKVEVSGIGTLLALLEKRKLELTAEGLFAIERKKNLPSMPKVVGVITSIQGAVIKDILHRISDRFPIHVLIWNVQVQGNEAAAQIIEAVHGFEALPDHIPTPDILIIARGGGSIEDLWAFNDEELVRVVAASKIPIISAVGHETDYTLLDLVADVRAPTPTAAAEIITPVKLHVESKLRIIHNQLSLALQAILRQNKLRLSNVTTRFSNSINKLYKAEQYLQNLKHQLYLGINNLYSKQQRKLDMLQLSLQPIMNKLSLQAQKLSYIQSKLSKTISHQLEYKERMLKHLQKLLTSYSYTEVLKRGFVLVKNKDEIINTSAKLHHNMEIILEFYDGIKSAIIKD